MIEYCLTKAETTPICQAPGNVTRYQTWVTMKISDKADKKINKDFIVHLDDS